MKFQVMSLSYAIEYIQKNIFEYAIILWLICVNHK